jgi:immune inhibitor A
VRPRTFTALTGVAAVACTLAITAPAQAQQSDGSPSAAGTTHRSDNRPGPKSAEQAQKRAKAKALLANGKATLKQRAGGGATVALSPDPADVVEFPVNREAKIFTILSEFGDGVTGKLGSTPGPLHNQIPEPDRKVDNSTYWTSNFDTAHYDRMFNGAGPSFKDFYAKQSGGRFKADITVTDWVKVPGNASTYGDNAVEDLGGSWAFVADTADAWYAAQRNSGKTDADIKAYLATLDVWDRYDFDGDGNFNEPDGYIDHFQAVHAGGGEEAGAGDDAIWSHRWYVNPTDAGTTGPAGNLLGGTEIGDTGVWIGDYTVEPENGGLGVFAHEFGHDLGLPDYYDTAGGENGTAFWTLMSSGSWLNEGEAAGDAIGTTPGGFGPEEKLYLEWLDYETVAPGESGSFELSPSEPTVKSQSQAVRVVLPDSKRTDPYTTPKTGTHAWWSGRGDSLSNTLTRSLQVPAGSSITVTSDIWYDIEQDYDFLYAEYSNDGVTWTQIGSPITGAGTKWAGKRWSFKAGGTLQFRFRYATDGGLNEAGAFLDNITFKVGNTQVLTDGAEQGDNGWTVDGWKISTGTEVTQAPRYYLLENRQYYGYDHTLEVGPYQFSEAYSRPDWVERFPFQTGMLVWLVDQGYTDNNVSTHPGAGYALPVDARPNTFTYSDGTSPSNRRDPFDAVFGTHQLDKVCLHKEVPVKVKGKTTIQTYEACNSDADRVAKATFDDTNANAYYSADNPQNSVKVAGVGVTATVTEGDGTSISVAVTNPAAATP